MRMQAQAVIVVLISNILKKVLVGRDTERGRAGAPFDLKTAVSFDLREIANRAGIGHNMAVAPDPADMTADGKEQSGYECESKLFHGVWFSDEMKQLPTLDSRIPQIETGRHFTIL